MVMNAVPNLSRKHNVLLLSRPNYLFKLKIISNYCAFNNMRFCYKTTYNYYLNDFNDMLE